MWNDLRFAFRTLRRSPGLTFVAVLSLALGIGANTAIFSLLYQVLLRSVPVKDPNALVLLQSNDVNYGWTRKDNNNTVFSYPMYLQLRDRNQAFSGLLARSSFAATIAYHGDAARATSEVVTGNAFSVLGVGAALGRTLLPSDDANPGQDPVIVLSYPYWAARFGQDPAVLNTDVLMNGHPVMVVGVAARNFRGLLAGQTPDFFAPISMIELISTAWNRNEKPDAYWLNIFGRLKPDISPSRATAMTEPLYHSILADEIPQMKDVSADTSKKLLAKPLRVEPAAQGLNSLREQWRAPLLLLMVMVGLVLLIACANVANLLIARATARRREIAVRLAVGATAGQLTRQLLTESVLLALAGGVLGLFLSDAMTTGLLSLLPADSTGGWLAASVDARLLLFSLAVALVTGTLFGLAPVIQARSTDVAPALKEQTGAMSAAGSQSRIRAVLVSAQICLSLLLLIGAGLFTRSLFNLVHNDPGFRAEHLVTFSVDPSLSGYAHERSLSFFTQIEQDLKAVPGVTAVARAQFLPFGGFGWGNGIKAPGSRNASDKYVSCGTNSVGAGYFRTFGIPLLAGREFDARDTETSSKVAIINETFARFLFEHENPIGRHIEIGSNNADAVIVGVVRDSKYDGVREKPGNFLYMPYEQGGNEFTRQAAFFIRTRGPEQSVMLAVRGVVKRLDNNVPVDRLTSMKLIIDETIYSDRIIAMLALGFGILATILAAIGLYGTISYSVARRTREFGIRLVLGADPGSLLKFVLREVGRLVVIGVAAGIPAGLALARVMESQLYGIRAYDPWVVTGATVLIAVVALTAGLGPALRAMRVEPMRALRYE